MYPEQKPKPSGAPMAKLVLVAAIIISLGALFGAVGYLAKNKPIKIQQPQVSPATEPAKSVEYKTADWQTYRNEEYGFEVKYPKELPVEHGPLLEPNVFYFSGGPYETAISLIVSDISEKEAVSFSDETKITEIIVAGEKGVRYKKEWEVPAGWQRGVFVERHINQSITVDIEHQGRNYRFHLTDSIENQHAFEIYNQILSTFKFIKSTEAKNTEVKNAIIYPNKQTIWKIGETYLIQWTPKDPNGTVDIRLNNNTAIDNATRLVFQASISPKNTGNYSFTVFEGLEPGNRYQFEIGGLFSEEFTIIETDETADWKTYRNEEYGFEIKYPDSWNLGGESSKMGELYKVDFVSSDTIKNNIKKVVTILVFENKKKYFVDEWLKDYHDIPDNVNGVGLIFEKEFSVNGEKGLKGGFGCCMGYREAFFVAKGNYVYAAQGGYMDFDIKPLGSLYDYSEDFNQILSSFKFIEKDENIASDSKKIITEYKIDSKTGARVEIASPDIMERNKQNEVKITISDWDKFGLNLYQSFLSIMNVADYRLGDKVYSNCKESNGQEKCLVPVTPLCNWPENVTLSPLVRIKTYNPPNEPDDHVLDFPNIVVKISTPTVEICDNKIDDNCNGKIDGVDSQCASFTVYVLPGEGLTNLARRVIAQYLEKFFNNAYLSKEGKIYAEDYIKRELKNKIGPLKTGERMDFSVSLIEQAIIKAKALSFQETASLGKYKELINYGGYRFISKTSSVTDSEKVWEMDENTKKQLMEVKHFTADEGKAWKVVENTGSIIIYYENKDIDKIFYLIGAYRENMMAQDYSFMESLLTHSIEISNDGINWEKGKVVYDNFYDKNNSSATGDGMGVGSFYLNVKDYNGGRLYVKFNLTSNTSGTAITLSKNIRTNISN